MSDFYLIGSSMFKLIWMFFDINFPGTDFSFGDVLIGFSLLSLSIWVLRVLFTGTPGISSTANNRRPKENSGVKKVR